MFQIEYSLDGPIPPKESDVNEVSLRYELFTGGILLKDNNNQIEINWGWVPVLDFGYCLTEICRSLTNMSGEFKEFEFTESGEKVMFRKESNKLNITTTFSDICLSVDFEEFKSGVKMFYLGLIANILKIWKNAENNNDFLIYLKRNQEINRFGL